MGLSIGVLCGSPFGAISAGVDSPGTCKATSAAVPSSAGVSVRWVKSPSIVRGLTGLVARSGAKPKVGLPPCVAASSVQLG